MNGIIRGIEQWLWKRNMIAGYCCVLDLIFDDREEKREKERVGRTRLLLTLIDQGTGMQLLR